MIALGKGGTREVPDFHLSRFACYLIAQNGDPRKPEIAFAQKYFAIQTRRQADADEACMRRHLAPHLSDQVLACIVEDNGNSWNSGLISKTFLYAGARVSMDSPGRSCEPIPLFQLFQLGWLESDLAGWRFLIAWAVIRDSRITQLFGNSE
jgi:hypothetical protein